jgi:Na+-driven multidrug efflux pump
MLKKYEILRFAIKDMKPDASLMKELLAAGCSMAFMSSLVQFGTVMLQTAINGLGQNIIVAHTAARKVTEIFMMAFSITGAAMCTFTGQNLGAGKYDRIRQGIKQTVMVAAVWCVAVVVVVNTICPWIIQMITATAEAEIIQTATMYLQINTALYIVPAIITLFRNAMQGFGDSITPVFSSSLELIVKVMVAVFLAPAIGYMGIVVSEPISWVIMVIPLILSMIRYGRRWRTLETAKK